MVGFQPIIYCSRCLQYVGPFYVGSCNCVSCNASAWCYGLDMCNYTLGFGSRTRIVIYLWTLVSLESPDYWYRGISRVLASVQLATNRR
jgi:hypothetical protein